ncbi:phosphate ABC transporter permease subunit PstC [[Clostridium] colinum]|uniref:phosphate ABC transporter permease subunit PstC n=1 Tax=[Clostridium] colinum TaxID=36835 RepID=UPI002025944D|nr:phosphate ABC transporter permease subunit PstC [[Clostridium] colinum]
MNTKKQESIFSENKNKSILEKSMYIVFLVCSLVAIIAVFAITIYMIISGTPAIFKIGIKDMLFNTVWKPTADIPSFGIAYIILTSIIGTFLSIVIGVPIGVLTAVFLSDIANKNVYRFIKPCVELLAGIPSIIYGLFGLLIINPIIYKIELFIFKNDPNHKFTGGANLLAAILVLAIMILPTVINVSETALKSVPLSLKQASLALGATRMQTIFKVCIPVAKSGIITAIVLGIGRAIGEAMAIVLVSGNSVNVPLPFNSVRFLTTGIVSEMSYSSGLHREALFTIGLILFVFIMVINIVISKILKKEDK